MIIIIISVLLVLRAVNAFKTVAVIRKKLVWKWLFLKEFNGLRLLLIKIAAD